MCNGKLSDNLLEERASYWWDKIFRETCSVKDTVLILASAFEKYSEECGKKHFANERTARIYLDITVSKFYDNYKETRLKNEPCLSEK